MKEDILFGNNRAKASKFSDENQIVKPKYSWGSQIVKGFSGEKKSSQGKKLPLASSNFVNQKKNPTGVSQSRVKRSLIGDLSCSVVSAQVHPQGFHQKDLFLELDNLRSLLQESKEREVKLNAELLECKRNSRVIDLEKEVECKRNGIDDLVKKLELVESEETLNLVKREEKQENLNGGVEMELVELRRLNKELQLQKRNLVCKISSMESQLATLAKVSESDLLEKIKEDASLLRSTNEDLCKQVEGLQMSRLNEVEELVYLRWVNSCLRDELCNSENVTSNNMSTPGALERRRESTCISSCTSENDDSECNSCMNRLSLIKKLKKWPISDEDMEQFKCQENFGNHNWDNSQNSVRRHSISGSKCCSQDMFLNKRRQSDGFIWSKEEEKEVLPLYSQKCDSGDTEKPQFVSNFQEASKLRVSFDVEKRALRIPNPPPRPTCTASSVQKEQCSRLPPPPPPPPPPKFMTRNITGTVQRAPQVVEFYHSLMKRDSRKDSSNAGVCDADVANVRSSMIGEIENRSSYLLAIKADVETQGEFVNSLIQEVNNAAYQDIEDVVAFVKWLDDELCFLVDERAVLKHFEWPEKKADTLREAAFSYRDLKKLEHEVAHYNKDDPQLSCDAALKKMTALSEKMERTVYNLLAMRDLMMRRCKEFQIPTEWMFDNGMISKIKIGSVKLAKIYMKRVATELQSKGTSDKDSSLDYTLLQGVRFAFRIHQFAGGFDAETMHAFEELRNLALILNKS